ncbi:hypothetical protein CBM2595_A80046 [Cupriavidus taiwanensis]|nr:hypothetical protein CBM2595_A80046 [Cupriavidus taiwanensis]
MSRQVRINRLRKDCSGCRRTGGSHHEIRCKIKMKIKMKTHSQKPTNKQLRDDPREF